MSQAPRWEGLRHRGSRRRGLPSRRVPEHLLEHEHPRPATRRGLKIELVGRGGCSSARPARVHPRWARGSSHGTSAGSEGDFFAVKELVEKAAAAVVGWPRRGARARSGAWWRAGGALAAGRERAGCEGSAGMGGGRCGLKWVGVGRCACAPPVGLSHACARGREAVAGRVVCRQRRISG